MAAWNKMQTGFWNFLALCLLVLCGATTALAQAGAGSVAGLVTDPSGAVIPKVEITLENTATGIKQVTHTSAGGLYSFVSVPPGVYQLTAVASGFKTAVHKNVRVTVDQGTTINMGLAVGSIRQVVTVAAASQLTDTSNSTVGALIGKETIDRVPLVSRDVYELVQLSAGVLPANATPNASDTPAIFNDRSGADVSSYTINGALQGTVQYMLDGSPIGVEENQVATLIPAFQIPQDAVDEFRVETQNTPVTFQSGAAGVISLVTKSGTNRFHGDAFVFLRPNVLAANDYFLKQSQLASGAGNQPAEFHRYQEGGAIGGPIIHNKLFFFADYEATQQDSLETGSFTVPTPAERTGDFSADGFTVYDPLVPDNPDGTRQSFPNNVIPTADLNAVALNYAQQFPLPNQPGVGLYHQNNYFASGLDPNNAQKFDIRIDYSPNQVNHIFGRFSFARLFFGSAPLYGKTNIFDPNYYSNTTNARNIQLADNITINSNSVLQLRYSFTRHFENQVSPGQVPYDMTQLGFPASLAAESTYPTVPYIEFEDYTSAIGGGTLNGWDFLYASENSDATATYTTVLGKHALDFGIEYEKLFMNEGQPIAPAGAYDFDDTATSSTTFAGDGSDFASFLLGMGLAPGEEGQNFTKDIFTAKASPYFASFIQDTYHVRKDLTLTFGLRWDVFGGRTERHNRSEYFDPTAAFSVNGVAMTGGPVFVGIHGRARSPFLTNWKDFAPRAAFAWQPLEKFVVRGGAGFYYGPSTHIINGAYSDAAGYQPSTTWNATAYNDDGNSIMITPVSNPFPSGVVQPTGSTLGAATGVGGDINTVLHTQRTPTTYNFNFGIEYQFPHEVILSAGYVGSRGLFVPFQALDLNQLSLQTIGSYRENLDNDVPNQWEAALPPTSAFFGSDTVPQWLALEPYPQFSDGGINDGVLVAGYPAGDSEYSSLQTKVQKRLSKHFTTLASFTWGKLMTDNSNPPLDFLGFHGNEGPQDWRNMEFEHALSSQDVKNQFSWMTSYDLPAGQGRALDLHGATNQILGNWTINTIVYLSTGVPVNAPNGTNNPYFAQRVDMNCDPGKHAPHTVDEWFSYTCFSQPADQFVAGTATAFLSHVRTNGAHNLDLSVYKNFPIREGKNIRLEIAAFNVTNSVQLGYPNIFWTPDANPETMEGFGQITGDVNTPRQFQMAARFTF